MKRRLEGSLTFVQVNLGKKVKPMENNTRQEGTLTFVKLSLYKKVIKTTTKAKTKEKAEEEEEMIQDGRPLIPLNVISKIPCSIRQKVLDKLFSMFLQKGFSKSNARVRAIEQEKELFSKNSSKNTYKNCAAQAIGILQAK